MTESEAIRQNYELGVIAGEAREQQRILKLLKNTQITCDCGQGCSQWDAGFQEAIALIKGDK